MAVKLPKVKVPKVFRSVKYSLAGVNCVFLLTGLLLLTAGITVLILNSEYDDLTTKGFSNIPRFVIATGVIILLTSGLGFYAAITEHFYFVAGYVVLHLNVLIFEIAIVITAFALDNNASSDISSTMRASLNLYSTRLDVAKIWDDLQIRFKCCGVVGRFDFASHLIPVSCCDIHFGTISPFVCQTVNSRDTGCAEALGEWLSYNANVLAVSALVALSIQVVLTSLAGWLAWRSKFEEVELESY